jgi:acetyltransferase-like isoleucine patch superfamily enzyme
VPCLGGLCIPSAARVRPGRFLSATSRSHFYQRQRPLRDVQRAVLSWRSDVKKQPLAAVGDFGLPLWPDSSPSALGLHSANLGAAFVRRNACSTATRGKEQMSNDDGTKIIYSRTPESAAMLANVKRAMAITAALNRLTFNDADEIRALFSELIGKKVDESFLLIPPFYTAGGDEIRVGHNVFVNQNCTFYDLGGLAIADDVMIGPNVSIVTAGHPLEPSQRRAATIGKPIVIERNVWIAAGSTIVGGVTVGENSVVAAGSVVTKDVPANTLVGGNPARVIHSIGN